MKLTKEEIENMPAGEEMDKLIAEKLNLYTKEPHTGDWGIYNSDDMTVRYVRRFSTDLSAAWEVVEKMTDNGFYFELDYDLCAWTATFTSADADKPGITVNITKSNAANIICRAALLATESEKP